MPPLNAIVPTTPCQIVETHLPDEVTLAHSLHQEVHAPITRTEVMSSPLTKFVLAKSVKDIGIEIGLDQDLRIVHADVVLIRMTLTAIDQSPVEESLKDIFRVMITAALLDRL